MKTSIFILFATLLFANIVKAQTFPANNDTRHQTIQKGKVLRKSLTPTAKPTSHIQTARALAIQRKKPTDGSPRTQPMITKPIIPLQ